MRWDEIITAWLDRLEADAALVARLGGVAHIYPAQSSRPVRIPSVEYDLPGPEREEELFNPIAVQVDIFARGLRAAAQIEERIRVLTHRDVGQELAGEWLWMRFQDARRVEYSAEPGVVHRVLDFTFEPLRAQYAG